MHAGEEKELTWLPCKLFKIPDADDEQQDVVGESLLDVCRNQTMT